MKKLVIALSAALAWCAVAAPPHTQGQQNANSIRVRPGHHSVVHSTHVYRRPSTGSERRRHLPPGTSIRVVRDLGPWLVVHSRLDGETGFVRKSAILSTRDTKRVARKGSGGSPGFGDGASQPTGKAPTPSIEILSPLDGARVRGQQGSILVRGRVTPAAFRDPDLDVFFVLDVSGSTRKYAGLNFLKGLSAPDQQRSFISDTAHYSETDNSILGGAIGATRRLISQLDPNTTRIGLITVRGRAQLLEPLTDDFGWLHLELKEILRAGPYGGTHLADGLRLGIRELAGLGASKPRTHSTKIQMLLTDGYPTLPTGGGRTATQADIEVAIQSAAIARKAGVKVHVLGLGHGAPGRPLAAVEIARATGGTYTAVTRPDDIFNVLAESATIGVNHVEVTNETTGEASADTALGSEGTFASVVPARPGMNRIKVRARAARGADAIAYLSVHLELNEPRTLELDVFLEKDSPPVPGAQAP